MARAGETDTALQIWRTLGSCSDEDGLKVFSAGVGTDDQTGGVFTVSGLPEGATVVDAWLYWNGTDDGSNVSDDPDTFDPNLHDGDPTVTLDGVQAPDPERIGGPASWAGVRDVFAYAYRSDVSSLVSGNGSYVADGMDAFAGNQGFNNGMELVVVYRDPAASPALTLMADGLDLAYGTNGPNVGPGTQAVLYQFAPSLEKRLADVTVFVGGGGFGGDNAFWYLMNTGPAPNPTNLRLRGLPGAVEVKNALTGRNNQNSNIAWDSYTTRLTVPAGVGWLAVQVESQNSEPRPTLEWVGAVLNLPLACDSPLYLPLLLRM